MYRQMLPRMNSNRHLFYSTKTFANQALLRPLPIPELETTGERYKRSLIPIVSKTEHQQACTTIDQFTQGNFGKQLQARLHRLAEQEAKKGYSWINRLWENYAYLGVRSSSMYASNWSFPLKHTNEQAMANDGDEGVTKKLQLDQAASIVAGLLKYCEKINREQIEPEGTSSSPLCMNQLKHFFGTSRIPDSPIDKTVSQYPTTAKHIMVTYKNQLFSVQVINTPNGDNISTMAIKRQLEQLVDQVEATPDSELELPIGLLTAEDRDTWANIRKSLEANLDNACNFKDIDTSLFILSLDQYSSSDDTEPNYLNYAFNRNGYNRWFDKSLQAIVNTTGATGLILEHTFFDAILVVRMAQDILKFGLIENDAPIDPSLNPPRLLKWTTDDLSKTRNTLRSAEVNAKTLVDDLESKLLNFTCYGSELIKHNKISPDGWVQMAIQLAYYRLHGYTCPSYGIAATRRFLAGRSDIIRVCTEESVAFTKIWTEKDIPTIVKVDYLEKALARHKENTIAASLGQGIDAHLFGLYHQMTPEEAQSEHAAIFHDPIYDYSQSWVICTSNITSGGGEYAYYPPVVPNGYGICYSIKANKISFSLSAFRHSTETDLSAFRESLENTLAEFAETIGYYNEALDPGSSTLGKEKSCA